ncbi:MAG: hypothetical protein COT84_02000 [Chlamydiae bacterium CG10_big_fil_rev_8_21_14_0_10_35_9]|nr:MAG: hypothetical protein COT84_02000 [Chlamydiae bacterium CG10_big_fil_rev_8_21_14_0_10_35_9]
MEEENLTTKVKSRKFIAFLVVLILGVLLYFAFLQTLSLTVDDKVKAFDKILDFLVWAFGVYVSGNIGEKVTSSVKSGWKK